MSILIFSKKKREKNWNVDFSTSVKGKSGFIVNGLFWRLKSFLDIYTQSVLEDLS